MDNDRPTSFLKVRKAKPNELLAPFGDDGQPLAITAFNSALDVLTRTPAPAPPLLAESLDVLTLLYKRTLFPPPESLSLLFSDETQTTLTNLIWTLLASPALAAKVSLLLSAALSPSTRVLADTLLSLSLELSIQQKRSIIVLTALIPSIGAKALEERVPDLLEQVIDGLKASDYAALRGKLGSAYLLAFASSSDEVSAWEARWVAPVVKGLRSNDNQTRQNITTHLLPDVLKPHPSSLLTLLNTLSGKDDVTARVALLRLARVKGLAEDYPDPYPGAKLELRPDSGKLVIPAHMVRDCAANSESAARIDAFEIVSEHPLTALPLSEAELEIVKEVLRWNISPESAEFRQHLLSGSFPHLLTRMRDSTFALQKLLSKPRPPPTASPAQIETTRAFFLWLVSFLSGQLYPGAGHSRQNSAIVLLGYLEDAGLGGGEVAKRVAKGKDIRQESRPFPFTVDIYTPALVKKLLGCLQSSYSHVQEGALRLLERFPVPLPGLESREEVTALLDTAIETHLASTRGSESSTGALLIRLVYSAYARRLGWTFGRADGAADADAEVLFISHLLELLEQRIQVAEQDLVVAAQKHPMHGLLQALQQLFSVVRLDAEGAPERLRPLVQRASGLVQRVWNATRPVLSNTPSETEGAPKLSDHEEARASFLTRNDEGAEDDDEAESSASPRHQVLLSSSWRAMREAGQLLSILVTSAFSAGAQIWPVLWQVDELEWVGQLFATWLTGIRHRGTFSVIGPAYTQVTTAISHAGDPVASMPKAWMDGHLDTIATGELSTTRRSAGLPLCVLSILVAGLRVKSPLVAPTIRLLFEIARSENSVAATHALNTLRILFLDGKLGDVLAPFVPDALVLAVSSFDSPVWTIRNSSLLLTTALLDRSFGAKRNRINRYTLRLRTSFHDFFSRSPTLVPFFLERLQRATNVSLGTANTVDVQSELFTILLLLRQVQATSESREAQAQFMPIVEACASSRVWQVREAAAAAMTGVVLPADVPSVCARLLGACDVRDQNALHGRLLAIHRLSVDLVDSFDPQMRATSCNALLERLPALLLTNPCPPTQAAFLDVVTSTIRSFDKASISASPSAGQLARRTVEFAWSYLRSFGTTPLRPGSHALGHACVRFVLAYAPGQRTETSDGARLILECPASFHAGILDELSACLPVPLPHDADQTLGPMLLRIVLDRAADQSSRIASVSLLLRLEEERSDVWKERSSSAVNISDEEWDALRKEHDQTDCVPVKEALLPFLSAMLARQLHPGPLAPSLLERLKSVLDLIAAAANENEPLDARLSAVHALRPFKPHLASLPADISLIAHRTLLALVQDDDEQVRLLAAADMDGSVLLPVKAHAALWDEMARTHTDNVLFVRWLWQMLLDNGAERGRTLSALSSSSSTGTPSVLFAVEPPNTYREPLLDVEGAHSRLLFLYSANPTSLPPPPASEIVPLLAELVRIASRPASPIDPLAAERTLLAERADRAWEIIREWGDEEPERIVEVGEDRWKQAEEDAAVVRRSLEG